MLTDPMTYRISDISDSYSIFSFTRRSHCCFFTGAYVVDVAVREQSCAASKNRHGSLEEWFRLKSCLDSRLLAVLLASAALNLLLFEIRHGGFCCGEATTRGKASDGEKRQQKSNLAKTHRQPCSRTTRKQWLANKKGSATSTLQ